MTTIASSTTSPIARTIAKSVRVLMVNPRSRKEAKVPKSDTGTAIIGMSVDLQFCRKMYTISATMRSASTKVCMTSLMEA